MRASHIAFVGRHTANVVGMVLHEIGVQGGERLPHFERVFLVDAEDDGLREAVGLGHEAREMFRNGLSSSPQRHDPLEVPRRVFGVGDLAP